MPDERTCVTCTNHSDGFCNHWKFRVPDITMAEDCDKYKKLNKGMQIRKNKLDKKTKKRTEIKPEQKGLVCFVEYSEKIIERVNGKYRRPTSSQIGKGLQIENKILMANNRYKMVNRTSLKITKRYDSVPEWATQQQIDIYNKTKES